MRRSFLWAGLLMLVSSASWAGSKTTTTRGTLCGFVQEWKSGWPAGEGLHKNWTSTDNQTTLTFSGIDAHGLVHGECHISLEGPGGTKDFGCVGAYRGSELLLLVNLSPERAPSWHDLQTPAANESISETAWNLMRFEVKGATMRCVQLGNPDRADRFGQTLGG